MEPEFSQCTYDGYKCGYIIQTSRRVISSMENSYVRYPSFHPIILWMENGV